LVELDFAEPEPVIGVKLASALEAMTEQIEDHDAAVFAENAVGAGDGALGMDRVVQCLAENGEVDCAFRNWRIFDVAQTVFEIGEAVFLRELRAELDHLRRVVDRDHFPCGLGEELRKRSFAGAEIGDRQFRQE